MVSFVFFQVLRAVQEKNKEKVGKPISNHKLRSDLSAGAPWYLIYAVKPSYSGHPL